MVQQARDTGKSYQSNSCLLSLSGAKNTAKPHFCSFPKDFSSFTSAFLLRLLREALYTNYQGYLAFLLTTPYG